MAAFIVESKINMALKDGKYFPVLSHGNNRVQFNFKGSNALNIKIYYLFLVDLSMW